MVEKPCNNSSNNPSPAAVAASTSAIGGSAIVDGYNSVIHGSSETSFLRTMMNDNPHLQDDSKSLYSYYSNDDDDDDNDDDNGSYTSLLSRVTTFSHQSSSSTTVGASAAATAGSSSSACSSSTSTIPYWQKPIKVGYAFGAKKMTTMGVVMAEASRVQVIHEAEEEEDEEDEGGKGEEEETNDTSIDQPEENDFTLQDTKDLHATGLDVTAVVDPPDDDTKTITENLDHGTHDSTENIPTGVPRTTTTTTTTVHGEIAMDSSTLDDSHPPQLTQDALRSFAESTEGGTGQRRNSTIISLKNTDETDIQNIVRYFRSSCSSTAGSLAGSMSETTTSTPTTAYGNGSSSCSVNLIGPSSKTKNNNTRNSSISSHHQSHQHHSTHNCGRRRRKRSRHPVHISFVPLDCDQPLEDQHGGNFDLILHKLTEDILCCSLTKDLTQLSEEGGDESVIITPSKVTDDECHESRRRVQALKKYYQNHDYCCLVDDPSNVQTVMSRSDIAHVLQECLRDVCSASGIPVRSPRFVVIDDPSRGDVVSNQIFYSTNCTLDTITDAQAKNVQQQLLEAGIACPMIVKPLIAAGTKQSHSMLIALRESAVPKLPCKSIVQEYVNHNATLYKVYVLGDFVSVFDRQSLPNLPNDISSIAKTDLLKFDSQRPYPKMKDFGLDGVSNCRHTLPSSSAVSSSSSSPASTTVSGTKVTAEEVKPVVDVLKKAFGLELFGFDVLHGEDGEYLVVDVNYFPSYKEVKNFPFLLAQYLTQRVIEQRRKKREDECPKSMSTLVTNV